MSTADDLIPHMRRVQAAERELRELNLLWQVIESSASISCPQEAESILPMLVRTRARFGALQSRVVAQLAEESLAELRDELASTAQCAIDILVRNLYERSADVGFLATDGPLLAHAQAHAQGQGPTPTHLSTQSPAEPAGGWPAGRAALEQRLAEYAAKYTVYDDIVLLAPDGLVLARLDACASLARSGDEVIALALRSSSFVQRFAPSDLAADAAPALLFAQAVKDGHGRTLGVLVLRFRHHDEMARIFASTLERGSLAALLLLDEHDRVIASSDEAHVPLGARIQTTADGQLGLTVYAGREYLSLTRASGGYQGYPGPAGWRAHAMASVLTAFRNRHGDSAQFDGLALGNDELGRIQAEVDAINTDLRRVVWNGRLAAGAAGAGGLSGNNSGNNSGTGRGNGNGDGQARLKAVLQQLTAAGSRTRDSVALAIRDLYRSAFGRIGRQAQELARLAADILDRNLYERANDCRWWALSPVLERVLAGAADAPDAAAASAELNRVLAHINSLYTVYTRLVVFDQDGRVRGLSHERADAPLLGSRVDAALVKAVSALGNSQRYAVTPFAPSALSDGQPTYCYLAAVRGGASRRVCGGLAIVFNAQRELQAMLHEVLGERAGLAAYVDADGQVLASTHAAWAQGQRLAPGANGAVIEIDGAHHALARLPTPGYREFRRDDGQTNPVQVLLALRLGRVERRHHVLGEEALSALPAGTRVDRREFALFNVAAMRYALPAERVIEARMPQGLVRAPVGSAHLSGLLEVPDGEGRRSVLPVLNLRSLLGLPPHGRASDGVVLVLSAPAGQAGARRPALGLLVDDVASVLDIALDHIQPPPVGAAWLAGLLRVGVGVGQPGEAAPDAASDGLREFAGAGAREPGRDVGRDPGRDLGRDGMRDGMRDGVRDGTRAAAAGGPRDGSREAARPVAADAARLALVQWLDVDALSALVLPAAALAA